MNWNTRLQAALDKQAAQSAYRRRSARRADTLPPYMESGGVRYLNFAGNDYLGLSRDPDVIAAWQQALAQYGTGSGGSPLVTGYTDVHQALEHQLADWLGYESALLFPSGYAANQAVLLGLLQKDDILLADKLCHASMQEAAMLGAARYRRFPHNRYDILEKQLNDHPESAVLIASEGVFSMDGDKADIGRLKTLSEQYGAWLLIDDAHGIGILGEEGRGSAAAVGVCPDILVVTFGKAVGLMGAAVLCSQTVAEYLTQTARHLIYSTAFPPAQAAALAAALRRIRHADDLRAKLRHNIRRFQTALAQAGLADYLMPSETAIQPFVCGSNERALSVSAELRRNGLYVPAIRPPTVPVGSARLRITLTAAHEDTHIDTLVKGLQDAV
ncbi:8-amino-7-oxononanoate synthase [Neisseria montereyensis]|uniref:8-amino-7-oxononanoate synthase n=1 Tax=Neisseria montereyensis TaxID=2973938 RepID=A0ABT2FG76_9NEIS|nr:8-amino-7-oxononanoate synthase [Neisseria montereyensis]MCS4534614.1 8-amino-7-oxononanoate synthase [Neisseria montereyensis]